jgi:hypothetical protein
MAYAFLKGLGVDGGIAEIDVDAQGAAAIRATAGQTVAANGATTGGQVTLDIESRRWPFCFEGDGTSSSSTRSILPFVPFNDDLNRYVLKVRNLESPRVVVTWGTEAKMFTREQLEKGINLAAEFSRTPFDEPFAALSAAVADKQAYETMMIKQLVTDFQKIPDIGTDAEAQAAVSVLNDRLMRRWKQLEAKVRERLVPVKHSITIAPLAG